MLVIGIFSFNILGVSIGEFEKVVVVRNLLLFLSVIVVFCVWFFYDY